MKEWVFMGYKYNRTGKGGGEDEAVDRVVAEGI